MKDKIKRETENQNNHKLQIHEMKSNSKAIAIR